MTRRAFRPLQNYGQRPVDIRYKVFSTTWEPNRCRWATASGTSYVIGIDPKIDCFDRTFAGPT
jgi:hypothetical protein